MQILGLNVVLFSPKKPRVINKFEALSGSFSNNSILVNLLQSGLCGEGRRKCMDPG